MQIPQIETERLRLRSWQQSDAKAFAMLNANADFIRYIGEGKPISEAQSWRVMAMLMGHWQLKGFGLWLVELKETGAFVGRVGFWEPMEWPSIELGWGIHPDYWGKGIGREAAVAAARWGFGDEQGGLNLTETISIIQPENHPSKKLAQRLGSTFSHSQLLSGSEVEIYTLTKANFEQRLI